MIEKLNLTGSKVFYIVIHMKIWHKMCLDCFLIIYQNDNENGSGNVHPYNEHNGRKFRTGLFLDDFVDFTLN